MTFNKHAIQSLLKRRGARVAAAFVLTLVLYKVYSLAAVPLIEPTVGERSLTETQHLDGMITSAQQRIEALRPLFPEGSWELDNPKILETGQFRLLMQDYQNLDDNQVQIHRCTIIFDAGKPDDAEQVRNRQAVVLQSPEGATLKFDKPLDLRRMDVGRLISGDLRGKITIRSHGKAADGSEKLEILTRDVHLTEHEVSTPHPVDFRLGKSFGRGRRMYMKLSQGDPLAPGPRRGPNVAGVESFLVQQIERLHLDTGKARLPGGDKTAQADKAATGSKTEQDNLPLEITCGGPFLFNVAKRVATFEDRQKGVDVWRIQPTGRWDQLHCEVLSILFAERRDAPGKSGTGDDAGGSLNLAPAAIRAEGNPVTLDAPNQQVHARGQRLEYDLLTNRIVLDDPRPIDAQEVVLQQGPNEIHARALRYQYAGPGRLGEVEAEGPGWLRGHSPERPEQQLQANWKQFLRLRPHEKNQLISLSGGASLNYGGFGQLDAGEIYFWLLELPPQENAQPGKSPAGRMRPDRMLARDNVRLDSLQLTGAVERMEIWFEQRAGTAVQLPSQPNNVGTAVALPSRQDAGTGAAVQLPPQPDAAPPPKDRYNIAGRVLRARVILPPDMAQQQPKQTELSELLIEENVRFEQTYSAKPDEKPLVVSGDRLHVVDASRPHAAITIVGKPAHFEGRGLTLEGPNINLNRGTNRLWVDGTGRMSVPLDRDLENRPLSKPGTLTVDWRQRMDFDGRTARFEESVTAATPQQKLRTETLEVQFLKPISFAEPPPVDLGPPRPGTVAEPGKKGPEVEQLLCRGGVFMENFSFDAQEKTTSHDRFQVVDLTINQITGAMTAGGPGWVTSVHLGKNNLLPEGRGAAPKPPPATPAPEREQLRCMLTRFQGSITGNVHRRTMTFHDRVQTAYAPVTSWDATIKADDPDAVGPDGVLLRCDHLTVAEMLSPLDNRRSLELTAAGNTIAEGRAFTARGARITYAQAKDLLVLEGDERIGAELFRQQQVGAEPAKTTARKILFWPKLEKVWIDGVRSLEVGGLPPVRPNAPPATGGRRPTATGGR